MFGTKLPNLILFKTNAINRVEIEYIESQLGFKIGEFTSFCKNKAGACAEVSAADKLIRMGSNPKNINLQMQ